jgi:hypothetical protein
MSANTTISRSVSFEPKHALAQLPAQRQQLVAE